ncbi:MAG: YggT family protein [Armatimonadota bacterium]
MMALIWLLDRLVSIYILLIIIRAVLSWFPGARYKYRSAVRWLEKITDPALVPFQRLLPPRSTGGLDLSPLLAVLAIQFIWRFILTIIYGR